MGISRNLLTKGRLTLFLPKTVPKKKLGKAHEKEGLAELYRLPTALTVICTFSFFYI